MTSTDQRSACREEAFWEHRALIHTTMCGIDAAEVLKLADQQPMGRMAGLGVKNGHEPSSGNVNGPAKSSGVAWCNLHDCAMTRCEKNGRFWYSHRVEGGKLCKGSSLPGGVYELGLGRWPLEGT